MPMAALARPTSHLGGVPWMLAPAATGTVAGALTGAAPSSSTPHSQGPLMMFYQSGGPGPGPPNPSSQQPFTGLPMVPLPGALGDVTSPQPQYGPSMNYGHNPAFPLVLLPPSTAPAAAAGAVPPTTHAPPGVGVFAMQPMQPPPGAVVQPMPVFAPPLPVPPTSWADGPGWALKGVGAGKVEGSAGPPGPRPGHLDGGGSSENKLSSSQPAADAVPASVSVRQEKDEAGREGGQQQEGGGKRRSAGTSKRKARHADASTSKRARGAAQRTSASNDGVAPRHEVCKRS